MFEKTLEQERVASADCETQVLPVLCWQSPVPDRLPHWAQPGSQVVFKDSLHYSQVILLRSKRGLGHTPKHLWKAEVSYWNASCDIW